MDEATRLIGRVEALELLIGTLLAKGMSEAPNIGVATRECVAQARIAGETPPGAAHLARGGVGISASRCSPNRVENGAARED